ncbi:Drug resistance protein [Ceratocystis platani]|uniref:Drug resistance protein n=1 Tax=Ceratocystis fimbriata f. sp. platani TaxID=88771 RepID=A0A0F8B2Z6_CERFI|nr:Drug resistance protein [Ceratocystis platani]
MPSSLPPLTASPPSLEVSPAALAPASALPLSPLSPKSEDCKQLPGEFPEPELPFSKGRCIALVITLAGASFMNRLIFVMGTAWIAIMLAINPFINNEIAFDLVRGLQGLGAAANVPTAIGILGTVFKPGKAKNYAFSTYAAGAPIGSVFGNLVAGLISEFASWKWVFAAMSLPQTGPHRGGLALIDWFGGALITIALVCLMFALTEGNVVGWQTPWVSALIVVSFLLVAAFAWWQARLEKRLVDSKGTSRPPLMKISIFKNTKFSAGIVIMGLFFSSFNNFLIVATMYFQDLQNLSPLQATLRFLPTGVMGLIVAVVVSQLLSPSLLFAVPIPPHTSYFAFGFIAMILSVFGADTTWPSLTLFTSRALPQEDQALGGALVNSSGQIGRSVGLALATAAQTAVMARARGVPVTDAGPTMAWDDASLKGLHAAAWLNFGLGMTSLSAVVIFFRGNDIVGRAERTVAPQKQTSDDKHVETMTSAAVCEKV